MARKSRRDKYASLYVDRHGKERCRFRRGAFTCPLPHPSDRDYRAAYDAALAGLMLGKSRAIPRSIGDLVPRFYDSMAFRKGGADWQKTVRQVLEPFREEFAGIAVRHFKPNHIETILGRKLEKRTNERGREVGGLHAARRLREQLHRLFNLAIKLEWITLNPVELADALPKPRGGGYYEWDEPDIAAFRERWAIGTKPRLALELMLWTGTRRGDARLLPPPKGGRIKGRAGKTAKPFDFPVAPMLAAAIEAMPAVGITTLLVTEYGKPFSAAGFGNWFKVQCRAAGLPQCTAHGLRKALARRAADLGASQQELKSLGQWSGDREVATYVAGANQRRLAESALNEVIAWELANLKAQG
jgi:integrase